MSRDRVLVTGGTGFLGRHLVRALGKEGFTVRLLARPKANLDFFERPDIEVCQGDVTDKESIERAVTDCRFVIHAAGLFRFWGDPDDFEKINVEGTFNVAEAAQAEGVARVIYVSTIAVVGDPKPGAAITELTPCQPQDAYQRSKLAAEHALLSRAANGGLDAVILRPGAYYGPGSRYGFNRLFVEEPMRGWRVKVEGGRRLTFPVFVPDVAKAAIAALWRGRVGEIYNICDSSVMHNSVNEIVSGLLGISTYRFPAPRQMMIALAALMEASAKISGQEPYYPLNLRHYIFNDWEVDSEKARAELEFTPTPLEEGLRQTVDWYLEHSRH